MISARKAFAYAADRAAASTTAALSLLASALLWFLLLGAAGVTALVVGVFMLAGVGWALVALGSLFLVVAVVLAKGMSRA